MKPDWKDAPEWANYLAQDEDSDWYWFEKEPSIQAHTWWADEGQWTYAECVDESWKDSLEQRP